jgi:hypothetical protein
MESLSLECPKCGQLAEASTDCGFYSARWTFTGITTKGRKVVTTGKTAYREYFAWEDEDNTDWKALEVHVDPY